MCVILIKYTISSPLKFHEQALLININSEYAFAVGLISPWGTGKSSFLNFLIEKIKFKDKNAIVINFYPWYSKSEKEIITHFFSTLSESLKEYHGDLNREIKKYSELILSLESNKITDLVEKGVNFLSESIDIKGQFEHLNKCIASLNRIIYITLDDIDRLLGKEIIECLKIIRNTANFKNIVFIVTYDNDYVLKELNEQFSTKNDNNDYSSEKYLEKIFQLRYTLTPIDKDDIVTHLKTVLKEKNISKTSEGFLEHKYYLNPSQVHDLEYLNTNSNETLYVSNYIENIRIANIVLNTFLSSHKSIGKETELDELFLVSILKILYPKEALELYLNLGHYFATYEGKVAFNNLNESSDSIFRHVDSSKVSPDFPIYKLNDNHLFIDLVSAIFFRLQTTAKSASYNENYKFYYRNALPKSYLTDEEFKGCIESVETLISYIENLDVTKTNSLISKLIKQQPKYKEQSVVLIAGLLYLQASLKERDFFQIIYKYLNKFKEESVEILGKIIQCSNSKVRYLLSFMIFNIKLSYLDHDKNNTIPLIIEIEDGFNKFHALTIKLLNKRVEKSSFDKDIFNYYYNCSSKINDANVHVIDNDANNTMREFVSKKENRIKYIKSLIIPQQTTTPNNIMVFRPFIDQTFDGYTKFEEFLFNVYSDNQYDRELKDIITKWEKYKKNKYSSFLDETVN
ncbi:KAP family NTPase [Halosquirtibacter laminarini]|uniref:KAP family NTPase n=1 Tax=Halosquirtibacter laminarini TaxID=3374600 RepID=A0AC61NJ16_9BACT|nr:KAP family NTPase [Prolixibacteraceae bacterium]